MLRVDRCRDMDELINFWALGFGDFVRPMAKSSYKCDFSTVFFAARCYARAALAVKRCLCVCLSMCAVAVIYVLHWGDEAEGLGDGRGPGAEPR